MSVSPHTMRRCSSPTPSGARSRAHRHRGTAHFSADLPQRLRDRIEGAARELELPEPLWLGKERLNQHSRCEGQFQAA